MESEKYLSVLNPEQKQAVMHEGSPLLILAGAGSGKTRVITTKIAWLIGEKNINPRKILAVTFTKKAASEMQERAYRLNEKASYAQIRTFHSFGSWFLRVYGESAGLASSFTVYDDDDSVTLLSKTIPELTRVQCARIMHDIARAKDYCLLPDDDLSCINTDPEFAEIYQKYETRLRETGNVDFGDLIMLPVQILKTDPVLKTELQNRFEVIMVDEYQDSNVAQFQLLQQLAGPDTYVCVVGDDDQSIYSFRGAEVQNILTFSEHFPNTQIIKLEKNYRSTSPILGTAIDVVKCNEHRLGKTLDSQRGTGKKPTLVFLSDQDEEAAFCAELIKKAAAKGCPYSDWAVLYRTNAQSLGFESEFVKKQIPYKVVGSLKFYEREEIKDVLAYLAVILNPKDEIHFSRIVNKPARALGEKTQQKIIEYARAKYNASDSLEFEKYTLLSACRDLAQALTTKAKKGMQEFLSIIDTLVADLPSTPANEDPAGFSTQNLATDALTGTTNSRTQPENTLADFIQNLVKITGLAEYHSEQDEIAGTQKVANMQELANSALLYPKTLEGLTAFFDHIELDRTLTENEDDPDSVTLITLHNTKGLEYPRVIITGIEEGVFPRKDKEGMDLEEERRLFYVGITRAKDELYLTTCASRRLYGRYEYVSPSRFLKEIDITGIDVLGKLPPAFSKKPAASANKKTDPLYEKWKPGTKVYHDDYGYGVVSSAWYDEDDLLIKASFESGTQKTLMPDYQRGRLMVVKDD